MRTVVREMQNFRAEEGWRRVGKGQQTVLAAGREKVGINEEKEKVRGMAGGVLQ